LKKKESS